MNGPVENLSMRAEKGWGREAMNRDLFKPSGSILKSNRFSQGWLDSIGNSRMVLAEKGLTGLILKKCYSAELISPGSGIFGRFDHGVVGVYAIGVAEIVVPQTHEEWQQSMVKRQTDIDQMLAFYEECDLQQRAIAILQFLLQRYGLSTVQAIPTDLLALLTGANQTIISLAWTQLLTAETSVESIQTLSSSHSLIGIKFQGQETSTVRLSDAIEGKPETTQVKAQDPHQNRWTVAVSATMIAALGLTLGSLLYLRGRPTSAESTASVSGQSSKRRILPVATHRIKASEGYSVERTYVGEIQAKRTSDVGFEIPGTLVSFPLREGDRVQAGDVLARLDTRSLLTERRQLLAQRTQAQAQLNELETGPRQEEIEAMRATVQEIDQQVIQAQKQSQRGKRLYDQGAISRESYEDRYYNEQVLRKRQEQSQKRLDQLEAGTRAEKVESQDARLLEINASIDALTVAQSKTTLKAPFSGYIAKKMVSEGTAINEGQPILQLVESGIMEARIGISKSVADQLKPGNTVPITVGNSSYTAKVRTLLPNVDDQSRTVTVALDFKPTSFLPLGQTATLRLKTQESVSGYWLPTSALISGDRGLWSTYVLIPSQPDSPSSDSIFKVARREVEVLYTQGERVYVRGMLIPGEQVVERGSHRIASGQLVRVTKEPS